MTFAVPTILAAAAESEVLATALIDGVTRGAGYLMMAAGAVMLFAGAFKMIGRFSYGGGSEGAPLLFMGLASIVGGLFLPNIMTFMTDNVRSVSGDPSPTAPPTPTVTPTNDPVEPAAPADLTWIWITLAAIAALVLLAILVFVILATSRRARQARERAVADRVAREKVTAAWAGVHSRHDELLRKLLHSETDWDALFFTPALTDPSVPETAAMLVAMRAASTARDISGDMPRSLLRTDGGASALVDQPYPKAVDAFDLAWAAAERNAKRLGQKGIPAAERKTIKEIRDLLNIAENSAASSTERNLAYRRAQKLIATLEHVHVPEKAAAQLEQSHTPMLEAAAAR
ncbi:MAG: hypothetical protein J0J04_07955 [Microbacterium sp.]|uniref:hypothetical protein n=1 Tax=Microbacterium sp. TaxID=51671 RepID=UPI001AC4E75A|nr:hypothetical protein [Microbacterium sp.]MBN9214733.1 hypothetical protein [Microbacterium sp.]